MNILVVALATLTTCIATDLFLTSRIATSILVALSTSKKSVHVIRSNLISDHWKEKVLLVYSKRLLFASAQLVFVLLLIGCIYISAFIVFSLPFSPLEISKALSLGVYELIVMLCVGLLYLYLRKKVNK